MGVVENETVAIVLTNTYAVVAADWSAAANVVYVAAEAVIEEVVANEVPPTPAPAPGQCLFCRSAVPHRLQGHGGLLGIAPHWGPFQAMLDLPGRPFGLRLGLHWGAHCCSR